MNVSAKISRPVASSVARTIDSLIGGSWSPSVFGSNLIQNIGPALSYSGSLVGGLPVVPSLVGTLAQPRGQRCYLADGVDDFIAVASLTGSETVTSKQGTSTVTIAAGRINLTAGTVWEIVLSNGSTYYCNEESGSTAYDSSGNGRHGTITNATLSTFHSTSASVVRNYANDRGYTLSGSVVIPRNEAVPTQDASGSALQFVGPIGLHATIEVPTVTMDGLTMNLDLGFKVVPESGDFVLNFNVMPIGGSYSAFSGLLGQTDGATWSSGFGVFWNSGTLSWRVFYGTYTVNFIDVALPTGVWSALKLRKVGTTLFASVNGGAETSVACAASITTSTSTQLGMFVGAVRTVCSLSLLSIDGGITVPLQDGPGGSNTNRDVAWFNGSSGGVVAGAIVNGTVSTIWGTRTSTVKDYSILNGGNIGGAGQFVVGTTGANDASGAAKTLASGSMSNPFSKFVPNFWNAPSLVAIGSDNTDKYAPTDTVQAESVADTRFRKSGFSKYFAVKTALVGVDKTNAQAYVA